MSTELTEKKPINQKVRMEVFEDSIVYDEVKRTFRNLIEILNDEIKSQIVEVRSKPGFVGSSVLFKGYLSNKTVGSIFMFIKNVDWIQVEDGRLSFQLSGTKEKKEIEN